MGDSRVLILGGTGDALRLAERLAAAPDYTVTTSLAGRTAAPVRPAGRLRIGGFGGADGLAAFLHGEAIAVVVDATHPFAAEISRNAAAACAATGVPLVRFDRPPWVRQAGDRWTDVASPGEAAARIPASGRRVFLTVGGQDLAAFAGCRNAWFLVRRIDAADGVPLPDATVIGGRGPFEAGKEVALMRRHRIDLLVSRNSGGDATYAKIAAARELGLPVLMIRRPALPPAETVATIDAAMAWLAARLG